MRDLRTIVKICLFENKEIKLWIIFGTKIVLKYPSKYAVYVLDRRFCTAREKKYLFLYACFSLIKINHVKKGTGKPASQRLPTILAAGEPLTQITPFLLAYNNLYEELLLEVQPMIPGAVSMLTRIYFKYRNRLQVCTVN